MPRGPRILAIEDGCRAQVVIEAGKRQRNRTAHTEPDGPDVGALDLGTCTQPLQRYSEVADWGTLRRASTERAQELRHSDGARCSGEQVYGQRRIARRCEPLADVTDVLVQA